ncbi:hypothetical protein ESCO_002864 [Escovopsis weberi]|uniref:Uncharacterized protein n=1 Tax=Escovopsis weberi TaxID=150374 RepID=A0A0M8MS29_ESCWE|nr:hypothetical protein ESCO_002864 [Escovopsis weberi]
MVYTEARKGNAVSIPRPVALYIFIFNTTSMKLDVSGDTSSLRDIPTGDFTWQRGDIQKGQGLRLIIKVPDGIKGQGNKADR